jgi:hypothetical protein
MTQDKGHYLGLAFAGGRWHAAPTRPPRASGFWRSFAKMRRGDPDFVPFEHSRNVTDLSDKRPGGIVDGPGGCE